MSEYQERLSRAHWHGYCQGVALATICLVTVNVIHLGVWAESFIAFGIGFAFSFAWRGLDALTGGWMSWGRDKQNEGAS